MIYVFEPIWMAMRGQSFDSLRAAIPFDRQQSSGVREYI